MLPAEDGTYLATRPRQPSRPPSLSMLAVFAFLSLLEAARVFGNDPSAGSPTETLLRLLLPLNDQV